jgi:hypothetical protein
VLSEIRDQLDHKDPEGQRDTRGQ